MEFLRGGTIPHAVFYPRPWVAALSFYYYLGYVCTAAIASLCPVNACYSLSSHYVYTWAQKQQQQKTKQNIPRAGLELVTGWGHCCCHIDAGLVMGPGLGHCCCLVVAVIAGLVNIGCHPVAGILLVAAGCAYTNGCCCARVVSAPPVELPSSCGGVFVVTAPDVVAGGLVWPCCVNPSSACCSTATNAFSGAAVELTVAVVVVPLAVAVVVMLLAVLVDIPLAVLVEAGLLRRERVLAEIADDDIAPLE